MFGKSVRKTKTCCTLDVLRRECALFCYVFCHPAALGSESFEKALDKGIGRHNCLTRNLKIRVNLFENLVNVSSVIRWAAAAFLVFLVGWHLSESVVE